MSDSDVLQATMLLARRQTIHNIASTAFLLYDLLTTLDEEVEFVWRSPNTLPKYLYFISRYVGIFGQLIMAINVFPMFCFVHLLITLGYLLALILSVELSLMLRMDALYGKSRKVRMLIGVGFAMEMAISLAVNVMSLPILHRLLVPFPSVLPIRGCNVPTRMTFYQLSWLPILAFETLLFVLNTAKCISYGPLDNTPLIYRLFRDGSAYYAIIFVCMIICTVSQFFDTPVATLSVSWLSAVLSYSGCHLLLSIRKTAVRRQRLEMTDISSADIPHIPSATDSSLNTPHACLGRAESIELVPQRISLTLHLAGSAHDGDGDGDWAERCMRDWDFVDKDAVESFRERVRGRGRGSDESAGRDHERWLRRWEP